MKRTKATSAIYITLDRRQAGLLSEVTETVARIGLGQFDRLMSWTRDSHGMPLMGYTASSQVEKLTEGVLNTNGRGHRSQKSEINWDMHQVIRHRLSWDDAYRDGLVKEDGSRNWAKMMTVNYDEPLKRSTEPLLQIERQEDDSYRILITKRQKAELLHGIDICNDISCGDASKAIEALYADQSAGKADQDLTFAINSLLEDLRGLPKGTPSDQDKGINDRLSEVKVMLEASLDAKNESRHSTGYEPA